MCAPLKAPLWFPTMVPIFCDFGDWVVGSVDINFGMGVGRRYPKACLVVILLLMVLAYERI